MPDNRIRGRLDRVRQLLAEIHHVSIATVNEDGSPHNSPVFTGFDENLNAFWASSIDSLHSQNIVRTGQVFLVVFDSREGHGGLYIEAQAQPLENPEEARYGYDVLKKLKIKVHGKIADLGDISLFTGGGQQRIYRAQPQRFWVNASTRNAKGVILRDQRFAVTLEQLLA